MFLGAGACTVSTEEGLMATDVERGGVGVGVGAEMDVGGDSAWRRSGPSNHQRATPERTRSPKRVTNIPDRVAIGREEGTEATGGRTGTWSAGG